MGPRTELSDIYEVKLRRCLYTSEFLAWVRTLLENHRSDELALQTLLRTLFLSILFQTDQGELLNAARFVPLLVRIIIEREDSFKIFSFAGVSLESALNYFDDFKSSDSERPMSNEELEQLLKVIEVKHNHYYAPYDYEVTNSYRRNDRIRIIMSPRILSGFDCF